MRVLITGGYGCIGSWVARQLVERGDEVWIFDNPDGETTERWFHAAGCRRWFNIVRDTATHRILAVYKIGERPPTRAGST